MGVVYLAHDPRLDRHVAIKLLPPDLTRDGTAKQRFLQEAKAASALDHPNICTIFEINETDDGQLYLVMAHYEGETLKERIARGPLELNDAIDIARQVGQGLAEAHGAGIVHRDIKPANLLVTKTGVVKILDFGLAKLAGSEGMTQTGTTLGTVAYMSPEQARGQQVDHRTDIWSLGVVLYEMLVGTSPFQGENLLAILTTILDTEPLSLSSARVEAPAVLEGIVTRMLSKSRQARYQAVTDVLSSLREATGAPGAVVTSLGATNRGEDGSLGSPYLGHVLLDNPEAMLHRKGKGKEAKLAYATGTAERDAAVLLLAIHGEVFVPPGRGPGPHQRTRRRHRPTAAGRDSW